MVADGMAAITDGCSGTVYRRRCRICIGNSVHVFSPPLEVRLGLQLSRPSRGGSPEPTGNG